MTLIKRNKGVILFYLVIIISAVVIINDNKKYDCLNKSLIVQK